MSLLKKLPDKCWFALLTLTVTLFGCGGGGGGGVAADTGIATSFTTPNRVVLGPLAGTEIRAYLLDDLISPIEEVTANGSLENLSSAGSFTLKLAGVSDDDAWVLVTATGGLDIDANDDGLLDATPRVNLGSVHALAKAADWKNGGTNITVLSDIAWLYAQDVITDSKALTQRMDAVATELLQQDLNNDGVVNRKDITAFAPVQHKQHTQQNYDAMLPDDDPDTMTLVEMIHADATKAEKRTWVAETLGQKSWPNAEPKATAGPDQSVNEQATVTLAGAGSDVDGTVVSYAWTQLSGTRVTLNNANNTIANFSAPALVSAEVLTFQLSVTDDKGASATDTVAIAIDPVNSIPSVEAGEDRAVYEMAAVTLSGSGNDSDGSVTRLTWTQLGGISVTLSNADSANVSFTAPVVTHIEELTFQLTATDNEGASASDTIDITVHPINVSPNVEAGSDQSVDEQTTVTLSGSASDSDGTVTRYAWSQLSGTSVALDATNSATISFTAPVRVDAEALTFQLRVTDNEGASAADTLAITVNPVNTAPSADAGSDRSVDEQTAVTLSGSASDSDGSITAYSWTQVSGTSVTLANANTATAGFTAPVVTGSETLTFQLTVSDNEAAGATDTVTITVNPVNAAPTANAGSDRSVDEQTTVSLSGSGIDSDGTIAAYVWTQLSGSSVTLNNANTASASFTAPALTNAETLTFDLWVNDNEGASATDSVVITVNPVTLVTVSGTVYAAAGSFIDTDVNDPIAPYASNDTPQTAQPIPNPATVGGFASAFGTGYADDRFGSVGDLYDAYEVYLNIGETVSLAIADADPLGPAFGDLDLYLYADSDPNTPLAGSISATATESLQAPYSGNFHVVVHAVFGATNYILSVGQGTPSSTYNVNQFSTENDFVADEIIIEMNDAVESDPRLTGQQKRQAVQERLTAMGVTSKAGGLGRPMLVGLGDQHKRQKAQSTNGSAWSYGAKQDKIDTLQALKALQSQPDVESAGLNYIRQTQAVPDDTLYPYQWHYPLINLPQAWDVSTGNNVVVAVVDTGVFLAHPDLVANLTNTGYDFISSSSMSNDGDGIDSNPDDPGDGVGPGTSSFHGTHVAGTIAAASNNGAEVAGVAWDAKIMPIRVLGQGGGTEYDIIQGVRYAAGLSNDSGTVPSAPAHIINMSLGGPGSNQTFQNTIDEVRAAGVIVIAAAGNDATSLSSYPAAYDGVVSVSSVRYDKSLAYYSNFGSTIDLAAPGGDLTVDQSGDANGDGILSTLVDDSSGTRAAISAFYQGTSMAAPHAAGVAALMKSVYPELTPAEFDNAISSGQITQDLGNDGATVRNDQFGYGLIDGYLAVQHANTLATGAPLPPSIATDQASLNFGSWLASQTINLSNGGSGDLYITAVTADSTWLSVSADAIDSNNLGSYTVTVDRSGLSAGTYNGNLLVSSDTVGTLSIAVTMTMDATSTLSVDTGHQWVLLLDAATMATVQEQGVAAVDGVYSYRFNAVAPGTYYIMSGSDSDNDYAVCDAGESCGGYPQANGLVPLTITGDTTEIDFTSSFGAEFSTTSSTDSQQAGVRRDYRIKQLLQ